MHVFGQAHFFLSCSYVHSFIYLFIYLYISLSVCFHFSPLNLATLRVTPGQ